MSAVSVASRAIASRGDRRRARTRQSLVDAAIRLMADGRGGRASIHEITFLQRAVDQPGEFNESDADTVAEMLLRMLGMTTRSAHAVAHRPLPAVAV